ncbi:MAG: hypothetical protein C5B47_02040 [Verrucomicrobia bacterium]|nr:MAG: hypothetical protein C5B47_02040 [Verrucomicrobiota bacterium]
MYVASRPAKKEDEMLDTKVIGNKEWVRGFLTAADIRSLEDFDCETRIRYLQQKHTRRKPKSCDKLVATHCQHGVPLDCICEMCRALVD